MANVFINFLKFCFGRSLLLPRKTTRRKRRQTKKEKNEKNSFVALNSISAEELNLNRQANEIIKVFLMYDRWAKALLWRVRIPPLTADAHTARVKVKYTQTKSSLARGRLEQKKKSFRCSQLCKVTRSSKVKSAFGDIFFFRRIFEDSCWKHKLKVNQTLKESCEDWEDFHVHREKPLEISWAKVINEKIPVMKMWIILFSRRETKKKRRKKRKKAIKYFLSFKVSVARWS